MHRKKQEKKLEEWQELSTAPIGLLELVTLTWRNDIAFNLHFLQFKFSSSFDYFLVGIGVAFALLGGAAGPIMMVMFGVIIQVENS